MLFEGVCSKYYLINPITLYYFWSQGDFHVTTNGPVQACSLEDHGLSPNAPHLFEPAHYIVHASIGKRSIGLRLEGILVTVRNEVAKVMFLQACVCPRGEYLTRHTPRDQVHPPGPGTPPGTRYPPPPEIRPLLRTVRILLECILVLHFFMKFLGTLPHPVPPVKLFNCGYG